jgi:hypothetical protein
MKWVLKSASCVLMLMLPESVPAQQSCPAGTLWEPYTEVCADVRDVRDQFLPSPEEATGLQPPSKAEIKAAELPVPGGLAVGITYRELVAVNSGRLHTKMFVYPDGLQPDAALPVLYTTATSHMHHGLEVVGIYSPNNRTNPGGGQLGLFAWPCLPDYPCPDGDTSPGWQWTVGLPDLTCNITHGVDQGGHAQKLLYYANHTDRLDTGTPSLWKSAAYLWNYCDEAWDLAWEHTYREAKVDCSVPGSGCAWWGPGIEIFGEDPYPQIAELGYENSLLQHDGAWSELRWPEAGFRDPAIWATMTPWQLFHLDPNRSYGVGNRIDINDAPVIVGQAQLQTLEDEPISLTEESMVISDPDVDPAFHVSFELTVYGGENYTHVGNQVVPANNYAGGLTVPVTVSDGAADSASYDLQINVLPVNDPPVFIDQGPLETLERTPLEITIDDIVCDDVDNDASEIELSILDGFGYVRTGNTITPELWIVGPLPVSATISDGSLQSAPFELVVWVTPDDVPPVITLNGSASVSIIAGSNYQDAGATAIDNVDGDVSDQIVVDNPVNTSRVGTYTVTFTVADTMGNTASATRMVTVRQAASAGSGSGGGSVSTLLVCALLLAIGARRSRYTPGH